MNLDKLMALSNFQPHKLQVVQDFMRENVLPIYEMIENFGVIICAAITIFALLITIQLLYLAFRKNEKVKKVTTGLKQKLMWDSLLRATMSAYFIQVFG